MTPEEKGQEIIFNLLKNQPQYLTQNWLQIIADLPAKRMGWKIARVLNGILSIPSSHLLIRLEVPECPDGFYRIVFDDDSAKLVTSASSAESLGTYPDIERVQPRLSPQPLGQLDQKNLFEFMKWANQVLLVRGQIVMDCTFAYCRQNPQIIFPYHFGLTEPAFFDPKYLMWGLKEATRYPGVYIDREPVRQVIEGKEMNRQMPLVLHYNGWRNCVLIQTFTDETIPEILPSVAQHQ